MPTSRRDFLLSASALAACTACGDPADDTAAPAHTGGPEPSAPWEPGGTVDEAVFSRGVVVGDASASGALVSAWTDELLLDLVLVQGTDDGWQEIGRWEGLETTEGWLQCALTDLPADTTCAIAAFAAGTDRRSAVSRFRTALAAGTQRVLRFGATSCLGGQEPWPVLSRAAEQRFDFYCLLGDTIYNDWGADTGAEAKWAAALAQPGFRDLAASTSLIATWDDHEVDDNWRPDDTDPDLVAGALAAFRKAVPQGRGPDDESLWRRLSWGDAADVFVLDGRGERRGNDYVSDAQLQWLIDGITTSSARFKVVLNSVPITDWRASIGDIEAEDRWQGYPEQRQALLAAIAGTRGVLWLTGDFHFGAVARVDPADGDGWDQWEVQCGPGGSPILDYVDLIPTHEQIPALITTWNTVCFAADPDTGRVDVRFLDGDGAVLEQRVLETG